MIIFLPLSINGAVHLKDKDIFISNRISLSLQLNTLVHEISHLLLNSPEHSNKWLDLAKFILPSFIYSSDGGKVDGGNMDGGNYALNIGNVTGIQNILTDYHLLQAYRKFSQRILGTEGQWELKGDNQIRLIPTPRGSYPVVVEYFPIVNRFTNATSKEVTKRMLVAEAKTILGNARSKFGNIPAPDGGSLSLNGEQLRTEGQAEKEKALQDAILLGEPLPILLW